MLIRAYHPNDWPRLCEIHDLARLDELRRSIGEAAFIPLEKAAETEGLFDLRVDVAEINHRVEGFVAFSPDELAWLYVAPDAYRRGIGRALVRHAIAHADPTLTVEVLEGNDPALQLYLSEGFRVLEYRRGQLTGNESFAAAGYALERTHTPHNVSGQ
ncbi:MAG: GNAT family N-acetyltransferase [Cyanobacteria bacterium J06626_18]